MVVKKKKNGDYLLLAFEAARLDPANCAVLQAELKSELDGAPTDIIIDMRGIAYAVSPAVNVILDAHERCRAVGRSVVLVGLQPAVRRILSLSGLSSLLIVRDDLKAAEEFLARENHSN
ncbi:MAG: STAS domain-containing protein [bacterium]|nr:STAS domain-containing protein [bacterium]